MTNQRKRAPRLTEHVSLRLPPELLQQLELPPPPPSVNNLFVSIGRRQVKSQRYRAWLTRPNGCGRRSGGAASGTTRADTSTVTGLAGLKIAFMFAYQGG